MNAIWIFAVLALAALASLVFSTLTYCLRDLSHVRFEEFLKKHHRERFCRSTLDRLDDLVFDTAVLRLIANFLILICTLRIFQNTPESIRLQYTLASLVTLIITLLISVAIPLAAARYAGWAIAGFFVRPLHWMGWAMLPVTKVMHAIDNLFRRAAGATQEVEAEHIEQDIMSVVQEGQREGVVNELEREMIESVIRFRDTQVGRIMTCRPEVTAVEVTARLPEVKALIESSGHSRIPVFDGTLDQIIGVLYARDLLKYLGQIENGFDLRKVIRPGIFVPETKLLGALLQDLRLQKVHIAIVLDEYGTMSGLVTIEDIVEELIGDIGDEHEPHEPAMIKQLDDHTWEIDARVHIDELNRAIPINLPEDAGFETLGGYVSTTLGRIPAIGTEFEQAGVKFKVLDANPAKVNRVRVELIHAPIS